MLCLFSNQFAHNFLSFFMLFFMFISANTILIVFYSALTQMYIFIILHHIRGISARQFHKQFSIKVRKFAACVQHLPFMKETIQKDCSTKCKKNCFVSRMFVKMRTVFVYRTVSPHIKNRFAPRF